MGHGVWRQRRWLPPQQICTVLQRRWLRGKITAPRRTGVVQTSFVRGACGMCFASVCDTKRRTHVAANEQCCVPAPMLWTYVHTAPLTHNIPSTGWDFQSQRFSSVSTVPPEKSQINSTKLYKLEIGAIRCPETPALDSLNVERFQTHSSFEQSLVLSEHKARMHLI